MAKLPYTYTICPDQEAPKTFTASCREMGELLRDSPDGDLTINQKRLGMWDSWTGSGAGIPVEDVLRAMCTQHKENANAPTTQT
jgi:hypothetical protein